MADVGAYLEEVLFGAREPISATLLSRRRRLKIDDARAALAEFYALHSKELSVAYVAQLPSAPPEDAEDAKEAEPEEKIARSRVAVLDETALAAAGVAPDAALIYSLSPERAADGAVLSQVSEALLAATAPLDLDDLRACDTILNPLLVTLDAPPPRPAAAVLPKANPEVRAPPKASVAELAASGPAALPRGGPVKIEEAAGTTEVRSDTMAAMASPAGRPESETSVKASTKSTAKPTVTAKPPAKAPSKSPFAFAKLSKEEAHARAFANRVTPNRAVNEAVIVADAPDEPEESEEAPVDREARRKDMAKLGTLFDDDVPVRQRTPADADAESAPDVMDIDSDGEEVRPPTPEPEQEGGAAEDVMDLAADEPNADIKDAKDKSVDPEGLSGEAASEEEDSTQGGQRRRRVERLVHEEDEDGMIVTRKVLEWEEIPDDEVPPTGLQSEDSRDATPAPRESTETVATKPSATKPPLKLASVPKKPGKGSRQQALMSFFNKPKPT